MTSPDFTGKWDFDGLLKIEARGTPKATEAAMRVIKRKTDPLTPRDTGALIASGHIQLTEDTASIEYNQPYAIRQHEDFSYHHPHGGPKYLERGIQAAAGEAMKEIEDSY